MHIRGFRHTHSAAPPDCFYPLLTAVAAASATHPPPTTTTTSSLSSSPSPPLAADAAIHLSVQMRPFRFALFPVGIHAATLTEAQARWITPTATTTTTTTTATADAPASPLSILDSEVARMVWKETWNLYDILYDEVPLLPWTEDASAAAAVAATVEEELQKSVGLATAATVLQPLDALAAETDGFVLASHRSGARQVVVCPHYYAAAALPESTFTKIQQSAPAVSAVPSHGPVVVLDLHDLPVALAGGKAMANVAWYTAFAAMQPDSALLRARAVVVRLPYAAVPSYADALATTSAATAPTMAAAFVELVDFIGEHITTVRHAMLRELGSKTAELVQAYGTAPALLVVGRAPEAMSSCLHALLDVSAADTASSGVVVFHGDHLRCAAGGAAETSPAHEFGARMAAEYRAIGEACGCAMAVETVLVPLKALLDGEEEPWDAYTLRERTRLNFCPCCGDCGHDGESDGADHGHSHGGHDHRT